MDTSNPRFGKMSKEHPKARKAIIDLGLTPFPNVEHWDGLTALAPDGSKMLLIGSWQKQMGKMILEGFWGNAEQNR